MLYVYALKSTKDGKRYIGFTNNLKRRIHEHNSGRCLATTNRRPFKLIYFERVGTRQEAARREKFLKSGKGREYINEIINS